MIKDQVEITVVVDGSDGKFEKQLSKAIYC